MSSHNTAGSGQKPRASAPQEPAPAPRRSERRGGAITWQQMAFIILVNAVISTMITILLVAVVLPALDGETPDAVVTATQAVAAQDTTQPAGQPTATSGLVVHVVQAGDTISGLAFQYDVPGEDIIAANNLENPNLLRVGMQLIIPIGGVPQATATFTPAPTPTDTPIPFESPAEMTATAVAEPVATAMPQPSGLPASGELLIEIPEILGVGDVELEQVIIKNVGERLADMQGWTLSDAGGNVYTFFNFRLWGGGSAMVHTRIGQDGNPPANFYWGKLEAIWSPGETATLRDADGAVVATYIIGP